MARGRGNSKGASSRAAAAPRDPDDPNAVRPPSPANVVPELLRRALTFGLSGFFTTNEAVRRALGEAVPKDWIDFAVDQSERTRAEFIERLAGEIARTLEAVDLAAILERVLEGRTIDVRAQIRLLPREDGSAVEPLRFSILRPSDSE
jgi:hypothetical protein